jgi:RpiR family carbohydrate utilization transcriptional regulator
MSATFSVEPFAGPLAERLAGPRRPGVTLAWLGQAGFVVDGQAHRIVIDPYLSDSLAQKYAGRRYDHRRMMPPPVTVEELGAVDLVLVTHHHTDHMDPATLAPLAARLPALRFVVPRAALGEAERRIGVGVDRLIPIDAGETVEPLPGATVSAVRAAHEALERDEAGHHRFLGYALALGGVTIVHSGDTVPFEGQFEEVARLSADCALLPVNGRSVELAAAGIAGNLDIAEAVGLAGAAGIDTVIAHHHGMFAFNTAEPRAIDQAAASAPLRLERARPGVLYRLEPETASENPRARNVLEAVRVRRDTLRRSERKVADLVLADAPRILGATLAETAERAGVSQPTVIRFCTAIGCTGFQDFRLRLAHSLALGTPATHSVLRDTDGPAALVEKIFDYTISSLDWARHHLDKAALAAAIALLEKAQAIEFFGFGASGIVARDAQQKFPLFGVPCGAQLDSHQQLMVATMLRRGDVAVIISNTGRTRSLLDIAETARRAGAAVVAITGSASPLAAACDVTLVVETLDNTDVYTPTISRIAALVVIDILSTAVALRRGADHLDRFRAMKRQLNALRFGEEPDDGTLTPEGR